jgi:hypothetical protein
MMQYLDVGKLYVIRHLRLQPNGKGGEVRGTFGGSDRLIVPISPKSSSFENWKQDLIKYAMPILGLHFIVENFFLRRKNKLKTPAKPQAESRTEVVPEIAPRDAGVSFAPKYRNCVSIKEILATTECPRTFVLQARVIDFFPFRLHDSFVRACTKCNTM